MHQIKNKLKLVTLAGRSLRSSLSIVKIQIADFLPPTIGLGELSKIRQLLY
ncbi:hypothetical protein FD48_GL001685 [Lactiplantibacillus paraplantarum DSM 10667]|nr:hypothetical protein FD48_GL001685 [Lactiplantibacillus paraplantarum DSM 10667]